MCCCDYADNMIEDFAIQFQFNYFGGNRSTQSWIYGCVVPKTHFIPKRETLSQPYTYWSSHWIKQERKKII